MKIIISLVGTVDYHEMFSYRDHNGNNLLQYYLNTYGTNHFDDFAGFVCSYYPIERWFNSINQNGEDLYNTMSKYGIGEYYKKNSINEKNKFDDFCNSTNQKRLTNAINYIKCNYENYIKESKDLENDISKLNTEFDEDFFDKLLRKEDELKIRFKMLSECLRYIKEHTNLSNIFNICIDPEFYYRCKPPSLNDINVVRNFITNKNVKNTMLWLEINSYHICDGHFNIYMFVDGNIEECLNKTYKKHVLNLNLEERESYKFQKRYLNNTGYRQSEPCLFCLLAKNNMINHMEYMIENNMIWITPESLKYYEQSLYYVNGKIKMFMQKKIIGYKIRKFFGTHNK